MGLAKSASKALPCNGNLVLMDVASTESRACASALAAGGGRVPSEAEADAASARSRLSDRDAEILYLRVLIAEAAARSARGALRAQSPSPRTIRDATRRPLRRRRRGRSGRRPRRGQGEPRAPQASAPSSSASPCPRNCRASGSWSRGRRPVPVAARTAREARRGRHQVARTRARDLQGRRDGPGEVHLRDCSGISQAPAPFFPTPRGASRPEPLSRR